MDRGTQPEWYRLVAEEECAELRRLTLLADAGALLELHDYGAYREAATLFTTLTSLHHAGIRLRDQALRRLLELPIDDRPPALRTPTDLARVAQVSERHVARLAEQLPPPADDGDLLRPRGDTETTGPGVSLG